jgi:hypothetical protein
MKTPRYILLFGMMRSGTSWLGKILDSHPRTLYKHEPDGLGLDIPLAPSTDSADQLARPILDFLKRLPRISNAYVSGRLPVFQKQYRSGLAQRLHHMSVLAAGLAPSPHGRFPVWQGVDLSRPDVCVVWKSIVSLGRLGVILRNVEDCRAIRILRHPCGYVHSVLCGEAKGKFISSMPVAEDFGILEILLASSSRFNRGMTIEHMRQLHPVERLAWMWVLMNEKAAAETAGDPRCTPVLYRDLCINPENETKRLFSFVGLDWNAQTANFIKVSTLESRPSLFDRMTQHEARYYGVFKNPIRAVVRWKDEMRLEDIERVYRVLRQSDLLRIYPESEMERVYGVPSTAPSETR